ncbi:MAG: peptidylprolyl isomerase [Candidatus Firestonebacteria bacterium]
MRILLNSRQDIKVDSIRVESRQNIAYMKKYLSTIFIIVCLSVKVVFAGSIVDKVVAIVNDDVILMSELNAVLNPILTENADKFKSEDGKKKLQELKKEMLNRMIDERLIIQEAKKQNVELSKGETETQLKEMKSRFPDEATFDEALRRENLTLEVYKERLKENIMAQKLVSKSVSAKIAVTDKEVKEYYDKKKNEFKESLKMKVRHILIKITNTEDVAYNKAKEILGKIKNGDDFSKIAKEYSDDETTKEIGGDLGIIKKGDMIKEFDDAAFSLSSGEVSSIIKTPLGLHIIKVDEVVQPKQFVLTDIIDTAGGKMTVEEFISLKLSQDKFKSKMDELVKELKSKAIIEIKL